mgnify:CR=1 FL=1
MENHSTIDSAHSHQNAHRALLYFDGDCYLCNRSVQFILANEKNETIFFAPLSLRKLIGPEHDYIDHTAQSDSIVFLENGMEYEKYDAVIRISRYLKFPYSLFALFRIIPTSIGNIFYNYIAKNRYRWIKNNTSCWVINPKNAHRFLTTSTIA